MTLRVRVFLGMMALLVVTLASWALSTGGALGPLFGKVLEERVDVALYLAKRIEESEDPRFAVDRLGQEVGVEAWLGRRPPREMVHRARTIERGGREILVLQAPGSPIAVPLEAGRRSAWLMVRFPADLDRPKRHIVVAVGLLFLIAMGAAAFASRWMLKPLELARDAMRRVADGDLSHRVPEGGDAAGQMGETFNEMAGRVEGLVRGQRDLMAAVSHELRTPLTRMRLQVEMLRDSGADPARLATLEADIGDMDDLVEELLESARLDQGVMALRRTPIDVLDLCVQALGAVDLGERTVSLDVPEGLEVEADERRLLRVLTNLLSNVARYTPAAVAVTLRAAREGDAVALTVADRGPGVPEADLARLFDPFFRAEGSRSRATGGLGLGLMLVRQIAEAHGGSVSAESREGGGLSVTVRVPARVAVAANEG